MYEDVIVILFQIMLEPGMVGKLSSAVCMEVKDLFWLN